MRAYPWNYQFLGHGLGPAGIVLETGKALVLDVEELARFDPKINPTLA